MEEVYLPFDCDTKGSIFFKVNEKNKGKTTKGLNPLQEKEYRWGRGIILCLYSISRYLDEEYYEQRREFDI